jgi:hypothetical protein
MIPDSPSASFLGVPLNIGLTRNPAYSDLGIDIWQLLPFSRGSVKIKVSPTLYLAPLPC